MNIELPGQIFERKYQNIEFDKNPFCGRRSVPMLTDGRTDTTKLIVVFHDSLEALTFDLHRIPN